MTATVDAPEGTSEAPVGTNGDDTEPPVARRPVPAPLAPWHDPHPRLGWLLTAVIAVLAGFTRFWALGFPHGKNFDEVYYATEAQENLRYGYEDNRGYLFIVHPPVGKWLIAWSEWLQGAIDGTHTSEAYLTNSLGWRIAPAVFGCLGVIMMTRIVRRMMRSNLFGFVGGLLMALEGMSLVLARTAILDIFLQTFIIASFGALVIDRDKMRERLGALVADGADLTSGAPTLGPRPWRLVAGVMMGLAGATKWTALSFFLGFAIMSLLWDRGALKSAGVRRPWNSWFTRAFPQGLVSLIVVPLATYLVCNLGWFTGENSYDRHWADSHGTHWLAWVPGPLRSLGADIYGAYSFHEGLDSPHVYQSSPWSWLVLGRPVDFYYDGSSTACGSSSCSREVLLIGTPLLWWAFVPMLLWLAWRWATTRDWRAGAVWLAFLAGWLVWFQDLSRTMFLFYMAPLVPFLIIGLVLALGAMLGPPNPEGRRALRRRQWGMAGVSAYLALVVADFAWMWPIFTGGLLTYADWHAHMWLPSWV